VNLEGKGMEISASKETFIWYSPVAGNIPCRENDPVTSSFPETG